MGTYLPGTGTLGCGTWCGAGLPAPETSLPNFYSPNVCERPTHSPTVALSTSLDGCSFFNFVVVRLPFNSISDSSE